MTRLANLLMQDPVDPAAPQLAPHFASSAVAIADSALQVCPAQCAAGLCGGARPATAVGCTQVESCGPAVASDRAGVCCMWFALDNALPSLRLLLHCRMLREPDCGGAWSGAR
jgi:hypothetical protein